MSHILSAGIRHVSRVENAAPTPQPRAEWAGLTNLDRAEQVQAQLNLFHVISAAGDGSVTVEIAPGLNAAERGSLLRLAEGFLRRRLDPALTVLLRPVADRNAARKWRGVKAIE